MRDNWGPGYFEDGIHLSAKGNRCYFEIAQSFINEFADESTNMIK